ncbi:hypothetical protein HN51_028865 [Arachis hypogaea]
MVGSRRASWRILSKIEQKEESMGNEVDVVPDLIEHVHRTTTRLLLHVNGYVEHIANFKWEVKELGLEHNGFIQVKLLDYGLEILAETLVKGLSWVKRCSDEGRALMSLDLQVQNLANQKYITGQ